jgi:serine-type D-Ala-D-Ala carboxypeptidase (penicillin-binding protein 5/6)
MPKLYSEVNLLKKIIYIRIFSIFMICIFLNNLLLYKKVNAEPIINAKCAVAIDANSKIVLCEKNSEMLVPIASTTKILTSLVAIKYGQLDKKIIISQRAAGVRGSTVGYKKGESLTLIELLYGLMLRSGNDAAIAIAEGVGGSVEKFSVLMNEYAAETGLFNSHFESPHGLDSENHYSTAYDLARITAIAKGNDLFNKIVSTKQVDAKTFGFTRSYQNINKILYRIPEANGVKTGYTGDAGKCLVTSATYNGHDIVIVVLNCVGRWNETAKIFDYIKKNYEYKNIYKKNQNVADIRLNRRKFILISPDDITLPILKNSTVRVDIVKPMNFSLPIDNQFKVGSIRIYQNDNLLFSENLKIKDK